MQTYTLYGRTHNSQDWDVLRSEEGSFVPVKARSVKEALSKLHRHNKYALLFQPGIILELRLDGKAVAAQTRRDDDADVTIMTLEAL